MITGFVSVAGERPGARSNLLRVGDFQPVEN